MQARLERELCFYLGFILLTLGVGLLAFSLYLLPYAIFNVQYPVPLFVHHLRVILVDAHGITEAHWQMLALLLPMVVTAIILLFLAKNVGINPQEIPTEVVRVTEPPPTPFGETPQVDPGEASYARKRHRWVQVLGPIEKGRTGARAFFSSRPIKILLGTILLILLLVALESYLIVFFM